MIIRKYVDSDEQEWLRCRVVSFLDCSYWNDVKTSKEKYDKPCISLVVEENGVIISLIDIEIDSADLVYKDKGKGAIIWHLAVLPEFRRLGVAERLWEYAKKELAQHGVCYCELWTQEDIAANTFYQKVGFALDKSQTWILCYTKGNNCKGLLNHAAFGEMYSPEELIFHAPLSEKEELMKICYRINEVRLYSCSFFQDLIP